MILANGSDGSCATPDRMLITLHTASVCSKYGDRPSQSRSQGNGQESEVGEVDSIKRSDSSADSEPTSIDAQARIPTRAPISMPYIPVVIQPFLFPQCGTKRIKMSDSLGRARVASSVTCSIRDDSVSGYMQSEHPNPALHSKHRPLRLPMGSRPYG